MKTQIYFPKKSGIDTGTDFIWHAASDSVEIRSLTAPFLKCEVIFNFGDVFSIDETGSKQVTFLSGLTHKPFSTTVSGAYSTVGLMLGPDIFYRRFGIPMNLLESRPANLEVVLGNSMTSLFEQIGNETCIEKKLRMAEAFFHPRHFKKQIPAFINYFLKQVESSCLQKGKVQICANAFGISSKHLIQTFKEIFGVTPHHYIRLFHFNNALKMMFEVETLNNSFSAFFDQSHFTGTFRRFTGITPTDYKRSFEKKNVHISFPNTRILEG